MRKVCLAAAAIASACLAASSAAATVMNVDIQYNVYGASGASGWFVLPNGLFSWFASGNSYSDNGVTEFIEFDFFGSTPAFADFSLDTSRGLITSDGTSFTLTWAAGDGPSPILSGDFHMGEAIQMDRDLTTATNLSFTRDPGGVSFAMSGTGWALNQATAVTSQGIPLSLDQPFHRDSHQLGYQVYFGAYHDGIWRTDSNTNSLTYAPAAVPEPATWALMIAGLGLTGAMLRRRRKAAVAT